MDRSGIAQKYLEQEMLEKGVARYTRSQDKAHDRQQLSSAEEKLFKQAVGAVAACMEETLVGSKKARGAKAPWVDAVESLGGMQCAVVVLRLAFTAVIARTPYTQMCVRIGKQIDLEMLARLIAEKDQDLLDRMMKRAKGYENLKYRIDSFLGSAQDAGFGVPTPDDELLKLGAGLFNFVLQTTSLFSVDLVNQDVCSDVLDVTFTEDAVAKMEKISEMESWMKPVFRPMVVPPRSWESVSTGCYLDPKIARTVPMVKTFSKAHLQLVEAAVKTNAPFVAALNAIQAVPLRINQWVLGHLEAAYASGKSVEGFPKPQITIPKDISETKKRALRRDNVELRAQKANFQRDLAEAREYAQFEQFYQPAQLDWRSRVYAKNSLNHQRADYCKALFEFAEGKRLTDDGIKWLAIHIATVGAFGKVDKAPLVERIRWTKENTQRILKMVEDPQADLWWVEADSPFVFLASCKAWADFLADPDGYVCHLPVHVDGSCSGLQHLSAMLRDEKGGKEVNLVPQEKPSDIYQTVANIVLQHAMDDSTNGTEDEMRWTKVTKKSPEPREYLHEGTKVQSQRWLKFGINRSVAKRCVMTYVYGSKQFGFAEHIEEDFMKPLATKVKAKQLDEHPFGADDGKGASQYMAKLVWDAVRDVVQAASEGMEWLQEVAGLLAAENKPVIWTTPTGFPVVNAYYQALTEKVNIFLWDREIKVSKRFQASVNVGMTKEILSRKARSSISPNFVHSLDASALMLAAIKSKEEGITNFLFVHDSFGFLPSDMERGAEIVRETFVSMYEHHDPLKDLYQSAFLQLSEKGRDKLTPPPAKGSLDLRGVLQSSYAFA
jgi:DNA-directed RNA polymerase